VNLIARGVGEDIFMGRSRDELLLTVEALDPVAAREVKVAIVDAVGDQNQRVAIVG